jgi:hypothetical protein
LKSQQQLAYGQYVGEAQPAAVRSRAIGGRAALAAIALLVLVVGTDHFSVRVGGVNLRVELIVGGLLALWFFVRSKGAVIQQLGIIEYALLGWLAANVLASLLFSPSPADSLKSVAVIAGVLTIYLLGLMLFRSEQMITWAAVAWVVVGAVVALLGLVSAFLYTFLGWTNGIGLERAYQDGTFILTPRVQSTMWEPNIFGSYCLTVGVLALALTLSPEFASPTRRFWLRCAAGCAFCGIMLSMTRTVWVIGPLALLVLMLVSLRLKLATPGEILKGMLLPAGVGIVIGLLVGNFLIPTLRWERTDPWSLSYQQVEQAVPYLIKGEAPPADFEKPQPQPGATQAETPTPGTAEAGPSAAPVTAGSTFIDKLLEILSPGRAISVQGRLGIFSQALEGWAQRPILGWGTGSFPLVYPPEPGADLGNTWIANLELHNLFDTGIVGLALFYVAIITIALRGARAIKAPVSNWRTIHFVLLGLLVGGAALFIAYQLTDATWMGFTWVLLAMLVTAAYFARTGVVPAAGKNG